MLEAKIRQTQRYYHFIALRGNKQIIKKDFFKAWGIINTKQIKVKKDCIINILTLQVDYQYYRGTEPDNSVNGNDLPPFMFDIILIEYPEINITLLGFPYRKLAIDVISSLVNNYKLLATSNFIKIDMSKLIQENHKHTDIYYKENHFWLGGVYITLAGDSFLSTVKLVGDKPLDSDIYKNYFKEKLTDNLKKSGVDKCILKNKIDLKVEKLVHSIASSIHIDKFGNYKVYVQSLGKNLFSIPAVFEFLSHLDCLVETPNNPVFHITNDE